MRPRGSGRVFLRGSMWWIAYSRNGHEIRESAETPDEKKAWKFLAQRVHESRKPTFVGPAEKKLTLDDLEAKIIADYERHGRRSVKTVKFCLKAIKDHFEHDTLLQLTPQRIEAYQTLRLKAKMARATVNREIRYLLHGYRLLFDAGEISYVPRVKLLEGENVREGFLNKPEFEAVAEQLKPDVRDVVRFLYNSAWRTGEALKLEWSKVDLNDWIVRLTRKNEKTKHPRTLPLVGELREIIENRLKERRPDCPYVFHRDGKPIKSFRRAFKAACKDAGLTGLVPHDMRRSAIRNMRKAGIGESDGMKISGHRTNSIYKRYDIVDEQDQRRTMERVQEHLKAEMEQRKVVPIRKAG
jgi:integrase